MTLKTIESVSVSSIEILPVVFKNIARLIINRDSQLNCALDVHLRQQAEP